MLARTGWAVTSVTESPAARMQVSHGRKTLLVAAVVEPR
jgi:hypothetical protein